VFFWLCTLTNLTRIHYADISWVRTQDHKHEIASLRETTTLVFSKKLKCRRNSVVPTSKGRQGLRSRCDSKSHLWAFVFGSRTAPIGGLVVFPMHHTPPQTTAISRILCPRSNYSFKLFLLNFVPFGPKNLHPIFILLEILTQNQVFWYLAIQSKWQAGRTGAKCGQHIEHVLSSWIAQAFIYFWSKKSSLSCESVHSKVVVILASII